MNKKEKLTYKAAGVDIDLGEEFIRRIRPKTQSTRTVYSMDSIGSFAGMLNLQNGKWKDPVLVACTDGVGTKLKLAIDTGIHDTVGIDLVAMSVNDLLVTGAQPLAFLDYLATSKLDLRVHTDVVEGIAEGCRQSQCALVGGETAELPGFYLNDDYDLAGFAVGIGERSRMYNPANVRPGDCIIGLPSSGIHSNGYSLARKVFEDRKRYPLNKPFDSTDRTLGETLLTPTRIYSREFEICRQFVGMRSAAHITGGGIPGNLPRALPDHLGADLFTDSWSIPAIFRKIQELGNIDKREMFRTFNMGLGMILIIGKEDASDLLDQFENNGIKASHVGVVTEKPGVRLDQPIQTLTPSVTPVPAVPRLAILGSGSGSNMGAICQAITRGELAAEIGCVISNNSSAYILQRARNLGLPALNISGKTHQENEQQNILDTLIEYRIDYVILAGYMKKLSSELIQKFKGKILNIHPALLPAFGGKGMYGSRVHQAVIDSGVKFSGVTVHLVDEDYDTGRILDQRIVPVNEMDSVESLAKRVLVQEHDLFWRVIRKQISKSGNHHG